MRAVCIHLEERTGELTWCACVQRQKKQRGCVEVQTEMFGTNVHKVTTQHVKGGFSECVG